MSEGESSGRVVFPEYFGQRVEVEQLAGQFRCYVRSIGIGISLHGASEHHTAIDAMRDAKRRSDQLRRQSELRDAMAEFPDARWEATT